MINIKTIIIYTTKKGCTKKCAGIIQKKIDNSEIICLDDLYPNLDAYQNVIIGSPVYIGMINKKIKNFIIENKTKLLDKQLKIFLCGMNKKEEENTIKANFDEEIIDKTKIAFVGGAYYFDKLSFFEKLIVRLIGKTKTSIEDINLENIDKLIS